MSDIYGYGGDPNYQGGGNASGVLGTLGQLISLYFSGGPNASPDSFARRFGVMQAPSAKAPQQAQPLPAPQAALPMSAPQVIGSAPQINTAGIPQSQQPEIMNQPLQAQGPAPSPVASEGQGGGAGPMAGPPIGKGPLGAGGGLFGGLSDLFNGGAAATGGGGFNPLGIVGGALGGLQHVFQSMAMSGNPQLQQMYYNRMIAQQMFQGLVQRGMPPDQALAIVSNPELQKQYYGLPANVGHVTAGGVDVPVLAGQGGIQYGLPGGGGQGGLDQLAAMGARFSQQQKAAEATGTAQGQANAALPTVSNNFDTAIAGVDRVLQDPHLNTRLGINSAIPPIPQTNAYDTQVKINELTGSLLPAAVQELQSRGAGVRNPGLANDLANAISDVKNAQGGTPGAFRESMTNLKRKLVQLKGAAYEQAGQQAPPEKMLTPLSGTTQSGVKWSIQ